jgi:DNA helicase-2/ATP-dependent DNA helicase PcrA
VAGDGTAAYQRRIDALTESVNGQALPEQVDVVIRDSGLLAYHGREKGERGQARVENLEELVNAARARPADRVSRLHRAGGG